MIIMSNENELTSTCTDIQSLLDEAKKNGISITEVSTGWSESSTSYNMSNALSNKLRDCLIKNHPKLNYSEYEGSLYDTPYRGFKCVECTETIIFAEQKDDHR